MPKQDVPDTLRPFLFHGLDLQLWGGEAVGPCPFCGREKFSVNVDTGTWRCFVCATGSNRGGGNAYTFIRALWQASGQQTAEHEGLAASRGLLWASTLDVWGVRLSPVTGEWLVPGYSHEGKLNQLYRYAEMKGKRRLLATPTLSHCLFGVAPIQEMEETVYVCEGPWDAMAWWEYLQLSADRGGHGGQLQAAVVAVPGCGTFLDAWVPLFGGKDVVLMYDNDHPRQHPTTGAITPPPAWAATQRTAALLARSATPPKSLQYLRWGEAGYSLDLSDGYDVRDFLRQ